MLLQIDHDLFDRTGEAGLFPDADTFGDGGLVVEADIGGLIRREDIGLCLFDAAIRNGLSVDEESRRWC